MDKIVFMTNNRAELTARSRAVSDLLGRLKQAGQLNTGMDNAVDSETCEIGTAANNIEDASLIRTVNKLHDEGRLFFKEVSESEIEIIYIASRDVRDKVFSATPTPAWTEKILKRHRKAYRSSVGTLFRFPFEDRDGDLQAFITDWSPFPAAAALAVHKDHPSVRHVPRKRGDYFTGHFVRNPLTGDLMPVWITTWVKPEFGTGVVAVNPAHDRVDLNFAREVGLPIRFGLVRQPVTSDVSTWPEPPVIKEGKTSKTGGWDGIDFGEALGKYFEVLSEQGYAEKYIDRAVSGCTIASFRRSDSGRALLCTQCSSLKNSNEAAGICCSPCGGTYARGSFEGGEILRCLLAMEGSTAVELLCPAAQMETTLLSARLLFYEIFARPFEPQKIYLIQDTEKTTKDLPDEIFSLASLVAAPLDQIAVLRQPLIDQVELFHKRHQQFLSAFRQGTPIAESRDRLIERALGHAKESLVRWNLAEAFSTLYKLQKELSVKAGDVVLSLLPTYFTLAFVLTGLEHPPQLRIADTWNKIQPLLTRTLSS
jgi:hypothetical protein